MIRRAPFKQNTVKNGLIRKKLRKGAEWIFQIFDGWVTKIATFTRVAEHSMLWPVSKVPKIFG